MAEIGRPQETEIRKLIKDNINRERYDYAKNDDIRTGLKQDCLQRMMTKREYFVTRCRDAEMTKLDDKNEN